LCGEPIEPEEIRQNDAASQNAIDIEILRGEEGFLAMFDAAAALYSEASIRSMLTLYRDISGKLMRASEADLTVGDVLHGA
jgi:hypothetical protein